MQRARSSIGDAARQQTGNKRRNSNGYDQNEKNTHEAVEETFRSATETDYETTRRAAGKTAQTLVDAGWQATTGTPDVMRENAERMREVWQSESTIDGRIVERSIEQFSRVLGLAGGNTRHIVQRSFHNLQVLTESGTNIAEGFRNASAE